MWPVFTSVLAWHFVLITVDQAPEFDFTAAAWANITDPTFVTYAVMFGCCFAFTHRIQNCLRDIELLFCLDSAS
jgi:hypothetical protein